MLKSKSMWIAGLVAVLMVIGAMTVSAQPAIKDLGTPPKALKGMNIIIGNYWADYDTTKTPPTAQWIKGSESQEKQLEWRKRIQREYGFTMQEKAVADWHTMPQVAATSILAGRPVASVFVVQADWGMNMKKQGLLFPISDAKYDFKTSNKIVEINQTINRLFTFKGKQYAYQIGYGGSNHGQVIFYNKRLFREAGLDENLPYDLQKSGQWTWDKFLEICKKLTRDTNNDGKMDTYALTRDLSTEILDVFVAGNTSEYIRQEKSGKFVNNTNTPAYLEALQFAIRLNKEGVMMPKPEGANWDWYKPVFNDGKVAMRLEQEYVRQDLANMKDNWGMVLPPKGPRAKDYVVFTDENVLAIPKTFNKDQVEAILFAVQAWNAPVDARWQTAMYPIFRDQRAVNETMAMIRNPVMNKFKNHILIPGHNRGDIAWEMWHFDGEPAQLIERVSTKWNFQIEDANEEYGLQ